MANLKKLEAFSAEELRAELAARAAEKALAASRASALAQPTSSALEAFDTATVVEVLRDKQKVIYGVDDRQDHYNVTDQGRLQDGDSVVALFRSNAVVDNGNGTSTLATQNFRTAYELCNEEPFGIQPIGAFCSGVLVAPDIIATAGHCVTASNVTNIRFIFGFRMLNATTAQVVINNSEIYQGVALLGREEIGTGPDWALIRIDRAVTNHRVAPVRRTGRVTDNQAVHVIGHPCGLPMKFAGGAAVRNNTPNAYFVANLDTYGGNSGSPVFNSVTREVEGILVRGETDFALIGTCNVSLVCPAIGCRGEDCTRVSEFIPLLPAPPAPPAPPA